MSLERDAIRRLEDENEQLRDRISQLEDELSWSGFDFPLEWCLTARQAKVLAALCARPICSKEYVHSSLYGLDPDGGAEMKIVDVFVCHIRRKLKGHGVKIATLWGQGYSIDKAGRDLVAGYIHRKAKAS